MGDALCELLAVDDVEFAHASDADDLFSILETLEGCVQGAAPVMTCSSGCSREGGTNTVKLWIDVMNDRQHENDEGDLDDSVGPAQKRHKCSPASAAEEGSAKGSHVAVERNRRKQMSEHLAVLRSLMPCFYVKRGDQASIIGGVVDYIKELQQVLQSLEAKKHRMVCTDQVLSPRPAASPRLPLSPRLPVKSPPPVSPRLAVPISPRTPPTPGSPYRSRTTPPVSYVSPAMTPAHEPPQTASYLPTSLDAIVAKLSAYASNSTAAVLPDVKVEFAGANLVLKTISHRVPGQAVKIVAALEGRSLEILQASISTINDTMVNSFTIKIGIECELSAEELVQEVRQTFL